jgi:ketosteroid isomerase-like protein
MSEHPNIAKLNAFVAAIQGGNLDAVLDAYAENGIYRVAGDNVVSGNYHGREAIRDFFIHLMQVTEGTMRLEVQDTLADDEHAVMFWRVTADRNGKTLDATGAMAFKINPAGEYSESWFLYNDQRAYDAFYA